MAGTYEFPYNKKLRINGETIPSSDHNKQEIQIECLTLALGDYDFSETITNRLNALEAADVSLDARITTLETTPSVSTLADVLSNGNVTSGNSLVVSSGDTLSSNNLSAGVGDLTFTARGSSITLNDAGNLILSGAFTATSIVGALNEAVALGGGETLAETLAFGNTTGGNNLVISVADSLTVSDGATITSPGSGGNSEKFGASAVASGANSIAVGQNVQATNSNSIAVGQSAIASGVDSIALGRSASSSHANSIVLGSNATSTLANQLMIGSTSNLISGVYFNGVESATTQTITFYAPNSSVGSGQKGSGFALTGGDGDGAKSGGVIRLTGGGGGTISSLLASGGAAIVSGGPGTFGPGGNAALEGGNSTSATAGHDGGYVAIQGGNSQNGDGGSAEIFGGNSTSGAGSGGYSILSGGNSVGGSGDGGYVSIEGGNSSVGGDGGDVTIRGGNATSGVSGDGGSIFLLIGSSTAGIEGNVYVQNATGGNYSAVFSRDTLTIPDNSQILFGSDVGLTGDTPTSGTLLVTDGASGLGDLRVNRLIVGSGTLVIDQDSIESTGGLTIINGISSPDGGTDSEAFGNGASVHSTSDNSIAIGTNAAVTDFSDDSIAIGHSATTDSNRSIAIGSLASTTSADSIAIGRQAQSGQQSISIGRSSVGTGITSTAIGHSSSATANFSVSIGAVSRATAVSATAIGYNAVATNTNTISIGENSRADNADSIAIGVDAQAFGLSSIIIGNLSFSNHADSIALGTNAATTLSNQFVVGSEDNPITSVYIGEGAESATPQALSLNSTSASSGSGGDGSDFTLAAGLRDNSATGNDDGDLIFSARGGSIPLNEIGDESLNVTSFTATSIIGALNELASSGGGGTLAETLALGNVTSGNDLVVSSGDTLTVSNGATITSPSGGVNSEAFGNNANASNSLTTAVGVSAGATGIESTAVGYASVASTTYTTAFGVDARAIGTNATSVGRNSDSSTRAVAIGSSATALFSDATAVGYNARANGANNIAIGSGALANQTNSIAIGASSDSYTDCVVVGYNATCADIDGVAIGSGAASNGLYQVAIGSGAIADSVSDGAIAIGESATSAFEASISIGRSATSTAVNQLVIGSATAPITAAYIGEGVESATPQAISLNSTSAAAASGAAGSDFTIAAGLGDGAGDDGDLIFSARGGSIPLNEVGDESLNTTSFTATSIIGALNELAVGGGGGGGETLAQTLVLGNSTGGTNIAVDENDQITFGPDVGLTGGTPTDGTLLVTDGGAGLGDLRVNQLIVGDGTLIVDFNSIGTADLSDDLFFGARGYFTPLSEVGNETLDPTAFNSVSIIGALNELAATGGGGGIATTVEYSLGDSGSPTVLTSADTEKTIVNEVATGTNYNTLPTASEALKFTFICQNSNGMRITASSGDLIRMGGAVTATAGYIESFTVGSSVTIIAVDADEWIATEITGTWSVN